MLNFLFNGYFNDFYVYKFIYLSLVIFYVLTLLNF